MQWWLIAVKEIEQHYIPKVNPKTSLSDPETPLITHSLKEREETEEEVRKRERKIKRGGEWMRDVKGPCRHLKSQQAQTHQSPKKPKEQIHTFPEMTNVLLKYLHRDAGGGLEVRDYPSFSFLPSTHLPQYWTCVSVSRISVCMEPANAVSLMTFNLFHKLVFMPQNLSKMSLFTVNRERERQREKQREGEVRWCQRWDFADSIFTHQTELFPVSTWPTLALTTSLFHSKSTCVLFPPPGSLSGRFPFVFPLKLMSFVITSCISLLKNWLPLSFCHHCKPFNLSFLSFLSPCFL